VLQKEQEEYAREGIDWVEIEYFNNAEICAMMGKPKTVRCKHSRQGLGLKVLASWAASCAAFLLSFL
jgi:hypothetical protein